MLESILKILTSYKTGIMEAWEKKEKELEKLEKDKKNYSDEGYRNLYSQAERDYEFKREELRAETRTALNPFLSTISTKAEKIPAVAPDEHQSRLVEAMLKLEKPSHSQIQAVMNAVDNVPLLQSIVLEFARKHFEPHRIKYTQHFTPEAYDKGVREFRNSIDQYLKLDTVGNITYQGKVISDFDADPLAKDRAAAGIRIDRDFSNVNEMVGLFSMLPENHVSDFISIAES